MRYMLPIAPLLAVATGYARSNGGEMCYLPASRCPEKLAALGPVAGFMSVEILRSNRNRHPIPLLEIHGTADRTTRWEGDGGGLYESVGGKHSGRRRAKNFGGFSADSCNK